MNSLGLLVLTIIALCQTGSAEQCFSCFSTRSNIRFEAQSRSNGTVRNGTVTTPLPQHGDCYYPNEFQRINCGDESGCEKLNAEVDISYMEGGNTKWGSFHVIYLGCGTSSQAIGCDYSPRSIFEYLMPYRDGIDHQIGKSLDWDSINDISGQACRCTGEFCNAATNVKMSFSLMIILSLFTFFWNKF